MTRRPGLAMGAALVLISSPLARGEGLDPADLRIVDLTHAFQARTVYWPTAPSGFELRRLARGATPGGWFYAANAFSAPEHGGTHLDAPLHFAESGQSVERIPLRRLLAEAVVIDVAARASAQPEFRLSAGEVRAFEERHGRIPSGSIVLLRTGWDRFWPEPRAYLGDDTPGDASKLRFPSFGAEAARLLVEERGVGGLGVDTASIDVGSSQDYPVHRIAAAREVFGLENLTGLDSLPARGATLVALPMKIEAGTGAPVRVIALLPPPPR
jgi:kynurenine formamidase